MHFSPEEKDRILRERAQRLAQPGVDAGSTQAPMLVIQFCLANERYAVQAGCVREVFPLLDFTPLPCVPPFFLGLVNVRGEILPLLDLRQLFELPPAGITDFNKVLILTAGDLTVCLLADSVLGLKSIFPTDFIQSDGLSHSPHSPYVLGLTSELVTVLDGEQLINDPRLIVRETVD